MKQPTILLGFSINVLKNHSFCRFPSKPFLSLELSSAISTKFTTTPVAFHSVMKQQKFELLEILYLFRYLFCLYKIILSIISILFIFQILLRHFPDIRHVQCALFF